MLMCDAPPPTDLAQSHCQSEIQWLTLTIFANGHAMPNRGSKGDVRPCGDFDVREIEAHGFSAEQKKVSQVAM
jgi:hypothetical protein